MQEITLKPFFTYYGGKYRIAPKYPFPTHSKIVEPFAGAAGYALRYPDREILLVDKNETICGVWDYLIHVSSDEILKLPLLHAGHCIDDFQISQEAKALIGFWLNKGSTSPGKIPSKWMRDGLRPNSFWGEVIRFRIANQIESIRHWKVYCDSYSNIENVNATWFIDPPYKGAGKHYKDGSKNINYAHLSEWCKDRIGQVIVCENEGADWLPFTGFCDAKASQAKYGGKISKEVIWTK